MAREIVLVAIGAVFGLGATMAALAAPSHFPNTPAWVWHWLFWGGVALMGLMVCDGACLIFWRPRIMAAALGNAGLFIFAAAAIAQFSPSYLNIHSETESSELPVAKLAALGWGVQASTNDIRFQISSMPLPPMKESATYFRQLKKPFRLTLQSTPTLDGLHYLADVPGLDELSIAASDSTNIAELHDFIYLTALYITTLFISRPFISRRCL